MSAEVTFPTSIFGLHDPGGEFLMSEAGRPGWIVFTHELGHEPAHTGSPRARGAFDHRPWAERGFGVIARLNHGYGRAGTIPLPQHYEAFAQRVRNFVQASPGCRVWVIGNEPNHVQERPDGQPITPQQYARCYNMCQQAIHAVPDHEQDQVLIAAVAPWNVETGDWITYFQHVLDLTRPDGITLHTYTHGSDPDLVRSEQKMDPPFQERHYHFRAYQDFMHAIPTELRHLPVYVTETDQDVPWLDACPTHTCGRGWVQNAYREIHDWNTQPGHQQIRCLALYRWPRVDRWYIEGKTKVYDDFRAAMNNDYIWQPATPAQVLSLQIEDLTRTLPHGPQPYPTRSLDGIRRIAIHHSASRPDTSATQMATYHIQHNHWPGIGYHFCILPDGRVQQTNALITRSYHVGTHNRQAIGICLPGNFQTTLPPQEQLLATRKLIAWLLPNLGLPSTSVVGHRELCTDTSCPGDTWPTWKPILLEEIR